MITTNLIRLQAEDGFLITNQDGSVLSQGIICLPSEVDSYTEITEQAAAEKKLAKEIAQVIANSGIAVSSDFFTTLATQIIGNNE